MHWGLAAPDRMQMTMPAPPRKSAKSVLVDGAVKPWHVVFLFFVSWSVAVVGAFKMAQQLGGPFKDGIRDIAIQGIFSAIILAFTVVVPEFRRSLKALFVKPAPRPSALDLGLAFALTLAWGYGLYRIAFCFPILVVDPEAFRALKFTEAVPPLEPRYLIALVGSVIVAPIGEELVFRGYLLNLWIARRGIGFALILSSLVFGAFHWERAAFAVPMGFVFALVYLRYDSLWPGILLHAVYNLLAFPWLLGGHFYAKERATIGHLSSWIPELVLALVFIPLWIAFWRRFKPRR